MTAKLYCKDQAIRPSWSTELEDWKQTMQVESLRDVLHWSSEFHRLLSNCLQHCSDRDENHRVSTVLTYLSQHETHLCSVFQCFEDTASASVLSAWCDEYLDRHPILQSQYCDKPFSGMTPLEIMAVVMEQHKQIIELYRYLHGRANSVATRELLEQLLALEEHEAMQMVRGSSELEDY